MKDARLGFFNKTVLLKLLLWGFCFPVKQKKTSFLSFFLDTATSPLTTPKHKRQEDRTGTNPNRQVPLPAMPIMVPDTTSLQEDLHIHKTPTQAMLNLQHTESNGCQFNVPLDELTFFNLVVVHNLLEKNNFNSTLVFLSIVGKSWVHLPEYETFAPPWMLPISVKESSSLRNQPKGESL